MRFIMLSRLCDMTPSNPFLYNKTAGSRVPRVYILFLNIMQILGLRFGF